MVFGNDLQQILHRNLFPVDIVFQRFGNLIIFINHSFVGLDAIDQLNESFGVEP